MNKSEVGSRIASVFKSYLSASDNQCPDFKSSTKLLSDTGLKSDDGVNIVLDLCTEFEVSLPEDFNATVHDDGRRERTFEELVTKIHSFVSAKERTP